MLKASNDEALPWYAIRVRSNFERTVSSLLRYKGFEELLPTYTVRTQWSEGVENIRRPLFAGYVFCRFDIAERLAILSTPGVMGIAGYGELPVAVDPREIQAVRAIIAAGVPVAPWPFSRAGNRVTVEKGRLAGIEGTVIEIKDSFRLVVSITLLQRSISAEIDPHCIPPDHRRDDVCGLADTPQIGSTATL